MTDLFGNETEPKFWTTGELAKAGGVDDSRIRQLAIGGRFPGARKFGHVWMIPDEPAQVWLTGRKIKK